MCEPRLQASQGKGSTTAAYPTPATVRSNRPAAARSMRFYVYLNANAPALLLPCMLGEEFGQGGRAAGR